MTIVRSSCSMARGSVNSINVKISRAKVGWAKAGPSNVVDSLCVVEKFENIIANYAGRKSNVSVRKFHKSAIKRRSKKKS